MEVILNGSAEEIVALVLGVQERRMREAEYSPIEIIRQVVHSALEG